MTTTEDQDEVQRPKPFEMLRLRSFVEKYRPDIQGQEDGEGGLVIRCPVGGRADATVVIRDAVLLGYAPVAHGPLPLDDYVKALVSDQEVPQVLYLSKKEIRQEAQRLSCAGYVDQLNPEQLRTANVEAFHWYAMSFGDFTDLPEVLAINQRYAQVDQEGQILVFDDASGLSYKREEFCAKVSGKIEAGVWLSHPARRCYDGVGLFPMNKTRFGTDYRKHPNTCRYYNLWQEHAFAPKPGDWSLLKEHVRIILCNDDEQHFDYLLNWMAHVVQRPWEKPGVAVVVKGKKGTGKGVVANAFRDAIGRPLAVMLSNKEHVIGRFASSKARAIFAQVEEALYAGDPRIDGILKADITEPTATIELKFKNPIEIDSYTRYWFNSNEKRAVPVSDDERRYFVLVVSDARMGDRAYFKAIIDQIENGGREAMLYELMCHDITKFDVRNVPWTDALGQEVLENLSDELKGILEIVRSGRIAIYDKDNKASESIQLVARAHTWVGKDFVYASLARAFREYGQDRGFATKVGTTLKEYELVDKSSDADKRIGSEARFRFRPLDDIRRDLAKRWGVPLSALICDKGRGPLSTAASLQADLHELEAKIADAEMTDSEMAKIIALRTALQGRMDRLEAAECRKRGQEAQTHPQDDEEAA